MSSSDPRENIFLLWLARRLGPHLASTERVLRRRARRSVGLFLLGLFLIISGLTLLLFDTPPEIVMLAWGSGYLLLMSALGLLLAYALGDIYRLDTRVSRHQRLQN